MFPDRQIPCFVCTASGSHRIIVSIVLYIEHVKQYESLGFSRELSVPVLVFKHLVMAFDMTDFGQDLSDCRQGSEAGAWLHETIQSPLQGTSRRDLE